MRFEDIDEDYWGSVNGREQGGVETGITFPVVAGGSTWGGGSWV